MFTGIVQHLGRVEAIDPASHGRILVIDVAGWIDAFEPGESIAVDGCCLTVVPRDEPGRIAFDIVPQTLRLTTLGDLVPGSPVNLERAVTPSTLLGGHLVLGHVDGTATVVGRTDEAGERRLRIAPPPELVPTMVPRGSITVAGVSLTLAAVEDAPPPWFEVALIPTTLERTTLGSLEIGDRVNLEADHVAKLVGRWVRASRGEAG